MFESLTIQNFRLFRDFQIKGLSRVNLIVGKNNTAKSSLLQAINLLAQWPPVLGYFDEFFRMLETRGETSFAESEVGRIRVYQLRHLFSGHQIELGSAIHLKVEGLPSFNLEIVATQKEPEKSNGNQSTHKLPTQIQIRSDQDKGWVNIDINSSGDTVFKTPIVDSDPLRGVKTHYITTHGVDYEYLSKLWDQVQLTPKEDDVLRALQIIEPDIQRIAFQTSHAGIVVRLKNQDPIPLGSLGDGIHRILGIGMTLVSASNGFLLVDEIDTGLHYRVITDMWKLILKTAESLNVQVFATTHSWDCVRSFAEALQMQENKNIGALFRLERMGEDIEAVKYTVEDLAFVMSQNIQNLEVR